MRTRAHWNPKAPKWALIEDVNEHLARISGDPIEQLQNAERMSTRDLDTLARVLRSAWSKHGSPGLTKEKSLL